MKVVVVCHNIFSRPACSFFSPALELVGVRPVPFPTALQAGLWNQSESDWADSEDSRETRSSGLLAAAVTGTAVGCRNVHSRVSPAPAVGQAADSDSASSKSESARKWWALRSLGPSLSMPVLVRL